MKIAAFLVTRRSVHPEHAEHYREHRTVRLEARDMSQTTVVIRCGRFRRWRVTIAYWIMRFAARLAGFKSVRLVRDN